MVRARARTFDSRLLRRARPARLLIGADVALGIAAAALILAQAALLAHVIARGFDGARPASLVGPIVALALVAVVRGSVAWGFEAAGRHASARVLSDLRRALVERALVARPRSPHRTPSAEVAALSVQGMDDLDAYFARYLPQALLACIVPFVVLGFVAVIDPESALIMLATLPLVPVFMWLIGRRTEQKTRERWNALQQLSVHFLDVVRGLPTLRAFNRSRAQAEAVETLSERYREETMATLRVAFLSGSVLELAATIGVALVAVTVGVRLADGGLGLAAGLTVLILAPELYTPIRQLGSSFHASANGLAVVDRIFGILDAPGVDGVAGTRRPPSPAEVPVHLEAVFFSYPSRRPVLDGFELELVPGETVALVGASGAGKSTVASLLLRLLEPSAGRMTVGGVDLQACDVEQWRKHVAWVPQQPTMFSASVAENIRLGAPAADGDAVRRAAELAGADAFVLSLPDGYDTLLGDGGRTLSSGQARRIALARAFVREEASLVVLDEPTADLDPESAALVADAIERLKPGRTILLIAHRPELAARADRVVALVRGRAVELAEAA